MPRDGSNIYHRPPGTDAVTGTTVASAPYNANVADVEQDLNTPRPIVAGGTGANSADAALTNLSGEKAKQIVTNFDSTSWIPGSFYAATTATNPPVAAHAFAGIAYYANATDFVVEARDITDAAHTCYNRVMSGGVWGAWTITNSGSFVAKTGDTMSGPLKVAEIDGGTANNSTLTLKSTSSGANSGDALNIQSTTVAINSPVAGPSNISLGKVNASGAEITVAASGGGGVLLHVPGAAPVGSTLNIPGLAGTNNLAVLEQVVRYDAAQVLTAAQQLQARQNIYAAPFDAMAFNGMQVNGAFDVSQEFGYGANTIVSGGFVCDGWRLYKSGTAVVVSGSYAVPGIAAGLQYAMLSTSTTAQPVMAAADYFMFRASIEGWRVARLGWGTPNAQPLTIAFWSMHFRAGTYSVKVGNGANNRHYVTTYNHAIGNTAQYNVVTIPGDTTGTWAADTNTGLFLDFAIAVGANNTAPAANVWGATPYIAAPGQVNAVQSTSDVCRFAGVLLLPGSEAPPAARSGLIMRPFDQELLLCQRYYEKSFAYATVPAFAAGYFAKGTFITMTPANTPNGVSLPFSVKKRANPTMTYYNPSVANGVPRNNTIGVDFTSFNPIISDADGFTWSAVSPPASAPGYVCGLNWTADARL